MLNMLSKYTHYLCLLDLVTSPLAPMKMVRFTAACLVAEPLNRCEAKGYDTNVTPF